MNDQEKQIKAEQYRELGIPRVRAVGMCVYQGNLLLEYHSEYSEMEREYYLPGETVKWGERARDTLRRFFKERFGMEISPGRFIIAMENKQKRITDKFHDIDLIFEIKSQTSEINIMQDGIGASWIDLNGIDRYNLKPDDLREAIFTQSLDRRKHMIAGELKFVK